MSREGRALVRRSLARLARFAAPSAPPPALRVLTYHRVNVDHPLDRLSVPADAFAEQMRTLAEDGFHVLPLEQALRTWREGGALPARAVAITFDDGYADNFDIALPVLARHSLRATFFLATGLVGSPDTLDRYRGCCAKDGMLSWARARELAESGHALGGHGRRHLELASVPSAHWADEIAGSADDIERETGMRPRLFCYARGSENPAVRRAVADAGYAGACTVRPGANPATIDPFGLRRTEVAGHDDLADFRFKLAGGFDGWHRLLQAASRRGVA
jgi:peptidoglycan/xylan/chitin deacetylase (PgdA/CDA1 family)